MNEIIYHWDIQQNSPDWELLRSQKITASEFKSVLAKGQGKTRLTYMYKLAGAIITGSPPESFSNGYTERGHELEDTARQLYIEQSGNTIDLCGFIENEMYGFSPDGLINDNGIIEIKTKAPHLLIEVLLKDAIPFEHVAQVQGGLMVSDREYCDFISFFPGLPLFVKRVHRDEKYIANLKLELEKFETELNQLIEKITKLF